MGNPAGRDVKVAAAGMAALLAGHKLVGLTLFAKGLAGLERQWRARHPEFEGGFAERWAEATRFYESTHRNPVNRALHIAGIPMILGGAVGLVVSPSFTPPWWVSAGSFATGWALNIVGHAVFEKNRPAFADDPLSFVAGPVWDLKQVQGLIEAVTTFA